VKAMGTTSELWYIGVLLEVVSTMSGTIGKQLIRTSELLRIKSPAMSNMAYYIGILINAVAGPVLDMAAYSFAAQPLIAPFGGLDVVWNALLAPYTLNEKLTLPRATGCALILVGATMAGCFGNHLEADYTINYLEETLVNFRALLYAVLFIAWFLFNRFVLMKREVGSAVRGISLGCTAGTIAGNMFCLKAAVELIKRSILKQDGEVWLHWLPYASLLGALFFGLANLIYMTQGLREYETLFMVTIYEGSMIVSGCVSGAVMLLDMRGLQSWRLGLYSLSVLIVVSGMCVIFAHQRRIKSSYLQGEASIATEDVPSNSTSIALAPKGLVLSPSGKKRWIHSVLPTKCRNDSVHELQDQNFAAPSTECCISNCKIQASVEQKPVDLESDASPGNDLRTQGALRGLDMRFELSASDSCQ